MGFKSKIHIVGIELDQFGVGTLKLFHQSFIELAKRFDRLDPSCPLPEMVNINQLRDNTGSINQFSWVKFMGLYMLY